MAQNITLLGASYTAVPAVTLPKTGGGTARFDDASITTATASDVASGKVFLASDGTITTGTSSGGGGLDIPTFNIVWDSSWSSCTVTCDETFQQCWDRFYAGADNGAYVTVSAVGDPSTQTTVAVAIDGQGNDYVTYTISADYGPYYDLVYHANGTIDMVEPSAYSNELNATANGDYYPSKGVYNHVVVNVPQPTETKTINITSNGTTTEDVTNYANVQIDVNVPSTTISPLSVTTNGTYTAPSGTAYSPVTVNVSGGGGASNIVTGTFTGTTTGAAMDVTLNYSGSGYPVAVMVYPSEGTYNNTTTPHPYYNLVQRYAIDSFIATKSNALTAPTYTDTTSTNYAEVYRIHKANATSNTSLTGGTAIGSSHVKVFTEDGATSTNNNVVKINSSTKMSVFIASNSYGFAVNIPYTYHVIYSS